jgi:hypothetical protein
MERGPQRNARATCCDTRTDHLHNVRQRKASPLLRATAEEGRAQTHNTPHEANITLQYACCARTAHAQRRLSKPARHQGFCQDGSLPMSYSKIFVGWVLFKTLQIGMLSRRLTVNLVSAEKSTHMLIPE